MLEMTYLFSYRFFSFLISFLPHKLQKTMMYLLAYVALYTSSRRREIIYDNLDIAFKKNINQKEKKKIAIHAYMNLIDTTFGIMKREHMDIDEVIKSISFENAGIVEKYQREGKKFMFVSGHYGNWELLAPAIAQRFSQTFVVVGRKLDSDVMDKVLKKSRQKFNVELVYKNGAVKGCINAVKKGKIVGILTDQATQKSQSIDVTFFGHKTTHTPIASILSRKFEMDMIPIYISTDDFRHYKIKVYEPIAYKKTEKQEEDLAILTQKQAEIMESVIRENPKQWFWMHRRWK